MDVYRVEINADQVIAIRMALEDRIVQLSPLVEDAAVLQSLKLAQGLLKDELSWLSLSKSIVSVTC